MKNERIKGFLISKLKSDFFQEIIYSALGCGIFTIIFFFLPDRFWEYPYREASCLIIIVSFLLIFIILNQAKPSNNFFKVNYKRNIILFSVLCFSIVCFLYFKTYFTTNGVQGDNFYRTALVTQMASSGYPQDFAYNNLSSFFGPLYWYCLALYARTFNIKPYRMLKLGMLFCYYILPLLLFEVWKKIYSKKISFMIATLSFIFIFNAYSPDRMIVIFFIIPFIMYYYENCTQKKFVNKDYIIAGVLGSILFCTYFLYFLLIPLYLIISLIQNRKRFLTQFKHIMKITLLMMLFSSWFWVPLLKDILLIGFESHQNKYFGPAAVKVLYTYYFGVSMVGAILFLGLVFIIRKYKGSQDFRTLGNLLISVSIIFLLGFFGILIKVPIMHVRFSKIGFYILIISFSLFIKPFLHFVTQNEILKQKKITLDLHKIQNFILIGIIFVSVYGMARSTYSSAAYQTAYDEDVRYDLIDIVDELDYENKIFLTNNVYVADYRPIFFFILPNPYFSHPSSLYNERVKFLIKLSENNNSKEFHEDIMDNEFDIIDFFWLDMDNVSNFVFTVPVDHFPENRKYYDITFKSYLFANEKYFKKHEIDGEIIFETKY